MPRKTLFRQKQENGNEQISMSKQNIIICIENQQQSYHTLNLNECLHLQYYGFNKIKNIEQFPLHTLYLNNNNIKTIQNLQNLSNTLLILNLSYNHINSIQGINKLHLLHTLNLSHNRINHIQSNAFQTLNINILQLNSNIINQKLHIATLLSIKHTLSSLDLSDNPIGDISIYDILIELDHITNLNLNNTQFSRSVRSYRKETISTLKTLLCLDNRPINHNERRLAEAWKNYGVEHQREVLKTISEQRDIKNKKIMQEIQARNKIVQKRRQQVYQQKLKNQIKQLKQLKAMQIQNINEQQKKLIKLKIEQLQDYLKRYKEQIKYMDLGLCKQKPISFLQKHSQNTIYLYHINQNQIQQIKQKYYHNQIKNIIPVNYYSNNNVSIQHFDHILHSLYQKCQHNIQYLLPLFNMQIYQLNQNAGRKIYRYTLTDLQTYMQSWNTSQIQQNKGVSLCSGGKNQCSDVSQMINTMNELD